MGSADGVAVVGLLDQTLVRIRHSVHSRVLLEATLIQICHLPDLQHLADLAESATIVPAVDRSAGEKKNAPIKPPHFERRGAASTATQPASEPDHSVSHGPGVGSHAPSAPASDSPARASAPQPSLGPGSATAVATRSDAQPDAAAGGVSVASWDQSRVNQVWSTAFAQLEAMTETLARAVARVEPAGSGKLRLVFPAESALACQRCDLPEHKTALQQALAEAAGHDVPFELQLLPPKPKPAAEAVPTNRPSRMQRMREIESNQLVKSCIDLFAAEIVRIDRPQ